MSENKNDQQSSAEQFEVTFDEAPENDMKKAEQAEEDTGDKKTRRKGNGKKKLKYGTLAAVSTVIFTAVVVLVNIIAGVFFKKYPLTLDLTKNAKYSISEKSEEYVKSIDRDVKFRVFAAEENFTSLNEYTKQAAEVLKRYTEYNSHITVEYIDIDSNPDIVSEYTDQEITAFSMIAESPSLDENG
ncbi:MAG: Gldg family protein, partial [Ruminococcus sp.]|nr:Gldg family protein [Ruminococcus sp.]